MQISEGRVVSVSNSARERSVVVEVEAIAACPRCAEGKGCGAGIFNGPARNRRVDAGVDGDMPLHSGDRVRFVLAPQKLLRAAIVVYGYPLAAAIIAALAAFFVGFDDLSTAAAALLGIGVGFGLARRELRMHRCWREFTPLVVENLDAGAH